MMISFSVSVLFNYRVFYFFLFDVMLVILLLVLQINLPRNKNG